MSPKRKTCVQTLIVALLISLMLGVQSVKSSPKTIVVPDDYPSITSALNNAAEGDTIFVKKGTYEEETLEINKTVSLLGEEANSTIISLHPPIAPTGHYNPDATPEYNYDHPLKIVANDVKLSGFTVVSNVSRISLISGKASQIEGNYIKTGIFLANSGHKISQNIVRGSIECIGSNHVISSNNLDHVWIFGSEIIVESNTISDDVGVGIGAWENSVFNNTIRNCRVGIAFWGSASNNAVYHNDFLNNSIQVQMQDPDNPVGGRWDDGYVSGGNFWSDYNGTDANADGIGDTPYIIDADNIDHYPLMEPVIIPEPSDGADSSELPNEPEPFPTATVAAVSGISVLVVFGAVLAIYFKKHNH